MGFISVCLWLLLKDISSEILYIENPLLSITFHRLMIFCLGKAEKELCFSVPAQSEPVCQNYSPRTGLESTYLFLIAFYQLRIYRHLVNLVFEAGISNLCCKLELCGRSWGPFLDLSGEYQRGQWLRCEKRWKGSIYLGSCGLEVSGWAEVACGLKGAVTCWWLGDGAVLMALQVRLG